MPQRPPTPPPPDDTFFFTVVNPYPEQPYQSNQGRKAFARWIAAIVGQQRLYAFYYRPKSPSMVIIEVSKDDFTDLNFRRLLGAHRWDAMLKTTDNVKDEVSSIFPCTLSTPRSLQKECWQKVDVEASWLHKWSPEEDGDIVYPYPLPAFCLPPAEDVMRNPLCRPLREGLFDGSTKTIYAAQPSAKVPLPYRSTSLPVFDPSDDDDFDSDDDSSRDGLLPTPFGITPPGLARLPSTCSSTPFVPAIHGADTPKSNSVKAIMHSGSDADTDDETPWAGYGEIDAPPPPGQCKVHGYMCSSGICRQQGLRKRDALNEERIQKRLQERNEWNLKREARQGQRNWGARRRGSGSGGSGGEARRDGPSWTTRGKDGRRANGAFSSGTGADAIAKPVAPPRPPHLRKKTEAAPSSPVARAAAASPPAPSSPSDSDGRSNNNGQSVADVTSRTTNVWGRGSSAKGAFRQDEEASRSSSVTDSTAEGQSAAKPRWADMLDDDDDDDDDDDEGRDEFDYLPRGAIVTELPGARYREDGADTESVFSGWDENPEPF